MMKFNNRAIDIESVLVDGRSGFINVGRASSSDHSDRKEAPDNLNLADRTISKQHCMIEVKRLNDGYSLGVVDCVSHHGTVVHDKAVSSTELEIIQPGDFIGLVNVSHMFESGVSTLYCKFLVQFIGIENGKIEFKVLNKHEISAERAKKNASLLSPPTSMFDDDGGEDFEKFSENSKDSEEIEEDCDEKTWNLETEESPEDCGCEVYPNDKRYAESSFEEEVHSPSTEVDSPSTEDVPKLVIFLGESEAITSGVDNDRSDYEWYDKSDSASEGVCVDKDPEFEGSALATIDKSMDSSAPEYSHYSSCSSSVSVASPNLKPSGKSSDESKHSETSTPAKKPISTRKGSRFNSKPPKIETDREKRFNPSRVTKKRKSKKESNRKNLFTGIVGFAFGLTMGAGLTFTSLASYGKTLT